MEQESKRTETIVYPIFPMSHWTVAPVSEWAKKVCEPNDYSKYKKYGK